MTDLASLKIYGAIEHARMRQYVLKAKSVTALENFINGYMAATGWGFIHPGLTYNVGDVNLNLFKYWLQGLPLNPDQMAPPFSPFLLDKWLGNEENAFQDFFVLLKEFKTLKHTTKIANQWNTSITGSLPHKIHAVLDFIRRYPQSFLTAKAISALGHFVLGYMYVSRQGFYDAAMIYNKGDIDINAFMFSIAGQPNIVLSTAARFESFLLENTSHNQEAAFEKFFLLLDDFRLLNKDRKSEGNVGYWWQWD